MSAQDVRAADAERRWSRWNAALWALVRGDGSQAPRGSTQLDAATGTFVRVVDAIGMASVNGPEAYLETVVVALRKMGCGRIHIAVELSRSAADNLGERRSTHVDATTLTAGDPIAALPASAESFAIVSDAVQGRLVVDTARLDRDGRAVCYCLARLVAAELRATRARLETAIAVRAAQEGIAADLHDGAMQALTSVNLLAESVSSGLRSASPDVGRRVERLLQVTQQAFAEVRAVVRGLRPVERPLSTHSRKALGLSGIEKLHNDGLRAALETGLRVIVPDSVTLSLRFVRYRPLPFPVENCVFRVCQEAVSNAVKHAQPRCVDIEASVSGDELHVEIRDDGKGFCTDQPAGLGIVSMRERVAAIGGRFSIRPLEPRGTCVSIAVHVPVAAIRR